MRAVFQKVKVLAAALMVAAVLSGADLARPPVCCRVSVLAVTDIEEV